VEVGGRGPPPTVLGGEAHVIRPAELVLLVDDTVCGRGLLPGVGVLVSKPCEAVLDLAPLGVVPPHEVPPRLLGTDDDVVVVAGVLLLDPVLPDTVLLDEVVLAIPTTYDTRGDVLLADVDPGSDPLAGESDGDELKRELLDGAEPDVMLLRVLLLEVCAPPKLDPRDVATFPLFDLDVDGEGTLVLPVEPNLPLP